MITAKAAAQIRRGIYMAWQYCGRRNYRRVGADIRMLFPIPQPRFFEHPLTNRAAARTVQNVRQKPRRATVSRTTERGTQMSMTENPGTERSSATVHPTTVVMGGTKADRRPSARFTHEPVDPVALLNDVDLLALEQVSSIGDYMLGITIDEAQSTLASIAEVARDHRARANALDNVLEAGQQFLHNVANTGSPAPVAPNR